MGEHEDMIVRTMLASMLGDPATSTVIDKFAEISEKGPNVVMYFLVILFVAFGMYMMTSRVGRLASAIDLNSAVLLTIEQTLLAISMQRLGFNIEQEPEDERAERAYVLFREVKDLIGKQTDVVRRHAELDTRPAVRRALARLLDERNGK